MRARLLNAAATAATVLVLPAALAAQQTAGDRGAFVVLLGTDTIAVERYTRTVDRVEGDAVNRSPQTVVRRWSAELGPRGTVTRFTYHGERADRSAPATVAEMVFGADEVQSTLRAGGRDTTLRVAARGAVPFMYGMFSHYELALRQAAAAGADSLSFAMVGVGQPEAIEMIVRRLGPDSMAFNVYEPAAFRARVDRDGRILGVDGLATTAKVLVERVERVADVDVPAIAAAWARRDSAAGTMGALSPLDSAQGTAGGAELAVVYSRPSLRGRQLMELLVPYDQIWRTGANAATILRTSRDVEIGSVHVPAGSYSLWTLPTRDGAQLVVNRQTGQWGTDHDAAQDLARIPLTVSRTSAPVEQLTFTIEPTTDGAMLRYEWGEMRWEVPVRAR